MVCGRECSEDSAAGAEEASRWEEERARPGEAMGVYSKSDGHPGEGCKQGMTEPH